MSSTLDKIIEEVRALSPEELQQVRATVDSLLAETAQPQMTEEEFARYIAAKGVFSLPEPERCEDAAARFDDYKPVTVMGKPLSEMIVEERR
jgi:hypothetical protein